MRGSNHIVVVRQNTLGFAVSFRHTDDMANDGLKKLGEAVFERRTELGYSQVEVHKRGGPSNSTMTALEKGTATTVSKSTLRKLDSALHWTPGVAEAIMTGSERPTVSEAQPVDHGGDYTDDQMMEILSRYSTARADEMRSVLDYAKARSIPYDDAVDEIAQVFVMAMQAKDGRQWTPPWDSYPAGFEPWREEWWDEADNRKRWHAWKSSGLVVDDSELDSYPDPSPLASVGLQALKARLRRQREADETPVEEIQRMAAYEPDDESLGVKIARAYEDLGEESQLPPDEEQD